MTKLLLVTQNQIMNKNFVIYIPGFSSEYMVSDNSLWNLLSTILKGWPTEYMHIDSFMVSWTRAFFG